MFSQLSFDEIECIFSHMDPASAFRGQILCKTCKDVSKRAVFEYEQELFVLMRNMRVDITNAPATKRRFLAKYCKYKSSKNADVWFDDMFDNFENKGTITQTCTDINYVSLCRILFRPMITLIIIFALSLWTHRIQK